MRDGGDCVDPQHCHPMGPIRDTQAYLFATLYLLLSPSPSPFPIDPHTTLSPLHSLPQPRNLLHHPLIHRPKIRALVHHARGGDRVDPHGQRRAEEGEGPEDAGEVC